MSNLLTERGRELVQARINADSIWCFPCGLAGRGQVEPATVYEVAFLDGMPCAVMAACRTCLAQAQADKINIVSMMPVQQPAHVEFLRNLLRGEAFPGVFALRALGVET